MFIYLISGEYFRIHCTLHSWMPSFFPSRILEFLDCTAISNCEIHYIEVPNTISYIFANQRTTHIWKYHLIPTHMKNVDDNLLLFTEKNLFDLILYMPQHNPGEGMPASAVTLSPWP